MDYEKLYIEFSAYEKQIKDLIANQQKIFKHLSKSMEKGDLKSSIKDMTLLEGMSTEFTNTITKMKEASSNFNAKAYMESGEFAQQMLEYCQSMGVDAKGENLTYEIFPYKVKLDPENLDVYIDKKRVQCLRPLSFVNDIKASRDKLMNVSFNPVLFANELAYAYDISIILQSKDKAIAKDADLYLVNIYKNLTPMRRFKKDYDAQSFAFDLARLYSSDIDSIDDGRKFQFGPSRNNNKAIRVLDKDGCEQFLATIRFFEV